MLHGGGNEAVDAGMPTVLGKRRCSGDKGLFTARYDDNVGIAFADIDVTGNQRFRPNHFMHVERT